MLISFLLITILDLTLIDGQQIAAPECPETPEFGQPLHVLMAMPYEVENVLNNPFQLTINKTYPIIIKALNRISIEKILPGGSLCMHYADSNASDTFGPWRAVEALAKNELDVVFGYANAYAMSPVARMSWLFKNGKGVPVITSIGQVDSLDDRSTYKLLTRMTGSYAELARSVHAFFKMMGWTKFAYLFHANVKLKQYGRTECSHQLGAIHTYQLDGSVQYSSALIKEFDPSFQTVNFVHLVRNASMMANIIILCGTPDAIRQILLAAYDSGMCQSGEYVFINIDISVNSVQTITRPWHNQNDTRENNLKAKEAFKIMKTITFQHLNAQKTFEHRKFHEKDQTGLNFTLNNYITALYDGMMLYATAVNESLRDKADIRNGSQITKRMWNRTFKGMYGDITMNAHGDRLNTYSLYDYDPRFDEFREKATYNESQKGWVSHNDSYIFWFAGKVPRDDPICGYDRSKCPKRGFPVWAWLLIGFLTFSALFLVSSALIYRHYKLEAALAAMSWRIRWDELYSDHKRSRPSLDSRVLTESKIMKHTDDACGVKRRNSQTNGNLLTKTESSARMSVTSEETTQLFDTHQVFTRTALYRGYVVAVKRLNISRPKLELTRNLLLEFKKMKDLQNDYITRFVGACVDPPHYCIVTEYCPKGSLQDILENDEIRLDKMMIYSLMHDLVKGMDYIHSTDFKSHGNLKSSNCVVDSRFVLKVTDFGLNYIRSLEDMPDDHDLDMFAKCRNKLWTAPELLRMHKPPLEGTPKGDVYSFGIVLHEMAFRQGVFYIENETPSPYDILNRVMLRQQPPFRPSIVETGGQQVDETMVSLMTKCWAENPADRPDFPTIKKQVRLLNKKYETSNIVDNLLKRMEQYASNLEGLVEERTAAYLEEKRKAENLLYQLLPQSVAAQLIKGEPVTAEAFESVTIYFSDIVGFTSLCSSSTPMQVVNLLNDLYTCFDSIIESFDVYKVETIGDAYMVVSGLPRRNEKRHGAEVARLSLVLLKSVCSFKIRHRPDEQLKLRIGLHSGPVCAGVVGLKMPRYCLFGDTVNTASRMESNGLPLKIHVSWATKEILDSFGCFIVELRGNVEMKGKGVQTTYWLIGEKIETVISEDS